MNYITVFIPTYNNSTTILEALKSIDEQKTKKIDKIIIIDDCSSDNTVEIINEYSKKSKLKYDVIQNKKPSSLAKKYNRIINSIHTPYLLLMHGDIVIKNKDAVEKYYYIMQKENVVAADSSIEHRFETWEKYNFWQKSEYDRLLSRRVNVLAGKFDIFNLDALKKNRWF